MFNTYTAGSQSVKISAVSGTICKTHAKSVIAICQPGSGLCKNLTGSPSQANFNGYRNEDAVVLQVMNSNENYLVCEYVKASDFYFEEETP